MGRRFGLNVTLGAADLGWSILIADETTLTLDNLRSILDPADFEADVLEGLDKGELPARRFRHVASTAMMVLKNPEGGRRRVGGLLWVSTRLYPLVKAACPNHPLLRETHREVLNDLLDTPSTLAWLSEKPEVRFRTLNAISPFGAAWVEPGQADCLQFDTPADALKRLHARLASAGK